MVPPQLNVATLGTKLPAHETLTEILTLGKMCKLYLALWIYHHIPLYPTTSLQKIPVLQEFCRCNKSPFPFCLQILTSFLTFYNLFIVCMSIFGFIFTYTLWASYVQISLSFSRLRKFQGIIISFNKLSVLFDFSIFLLLSLW